MLIKSVLEQSDVDAANVYLQKIKELDAEDKSIAMLQSTIDFAKAFNSVKLKRFDEARALIAPLLGLITYNVDP